MDFIELDLNQYKPSQSELEADWNAVRISRLEVADPSITALVSSLRESHVNGGALLARFSLETPPTWRWYIARNRLEEVNFFERFFTSPSVLVAFENRCRPNVPASELKFAMELPHIATGRLAATLASGGAYRSFAGTDRELLRIIGAFTDAAFEDRYSDLMAWVSFAPWSDWFFDVAWDTSFIWLDKRKGQITCLLVTDTD